MDYAGPKWLVGLAELAMAKEGVYQSSIRMARSWMDNHPGWLIYGNNMVVLIDDIERDGFRLKGELRGVKEEEADFIARFLASAFFDSFAIGRNGGVFNQIVKIGARMIGIPPF